MLLVSLLLLSAGELVYSTEHFDFIYSDETVESASEIALVAEEYYSRLVEIFGVDPELHIPVYFKSEMKSFNAYFTNYPSNHIVMFVTSIPTSLFNNVEHPLSLTFFHELTHAFTNNIRSPFVSFLSSVFGDIIAPGNLYLNKGFIEGIAVYVESLDGEGRLNDASSLYLVNQMAAENKTLHYLDISGARDITPGGNMSYILGASFLKYLSDTYGADKVSEFIVKCYKFPISTAEIIFKKIFGLKMSEAWKDYTSSVSLDFEYSTPDTVSDAGSWDNLTLHNGEVYLTDASTSGVFKVTDDGTKRVNLTQSSFEDLSFSSSYMLLPYVTEKSRSVGVVSLSGGTYRSFSGYYTGLLLDDEKVLLLTEEDRNARLDLYSIEDRTLLSSYSLGHDTTLSSGIALSGTEALFLCVTGGTTKLLGVDTEKNTLTLYSLPDDILLKSLSLSSDGTIAFSYIERNRTESFAKYGELISDGGVWSCMLSSDEYSGGIYSPVKSRGKVYFVSRFFDTRKVSVLDYSSLTFGERKELSAESFLAEREEKKEVLLTGESYNPLKYMTRGLLVPAANGSGVNLGSLSGLGVSYTIQDPGESNRIGSSFGYSFEKKATFLYIAYAYKDYLNASFFAFSRDGKTSVETDLTLSYTLYFNSDSRYLKGSETAALSTDENGNKFNNVLSLTYLDAYKMGVGRHEYLGWEAGVKLTNITPTVAAGVYVPRLLPFSSTTSMCYSIPSTFTLSLTSFTKPVIGAEVTLYLFTYEIQHSVRFIRLYFRNVDLIFTYDGLLRTEGMKYSDTYALKVRLGLNPLIGQYSSIGANLDLGVKYERGKTPSFSFLFDFGM